MAILSGMKEIGGYLRRSEATVTKMMKQHPNFPAEKLGGIWESDTDLIDNWKRELMCKRREKRNSI